MPSDPGTIVDLTPFLMTHCSRDLRYLFVSRAYARMLGRPPESIAGRRIVDVMGEDGFRTILPYVERVLAGEEVSYTSTIPFEGVGARDLSVTYTPERNRGGEVIGWVASILDVTDRRRAEDRLQLTEFPVPGRDGRFVGGMAIDVSRQRAAEAALRESEARFRTMADSAPVMIWVTDARGEIVFVNRGYREFFGIAEEQLRGPGGWHPLVHPDDLAAYTAAFETAVRQQAPFAAECRVRHADGGWRWIASFAAPRFAEDGAFVGHVGSSPDISRRKLAEDARRRSEEQLTLVSDAVPALIAYVDTACRYRFCNRTYTEWFELRPDDILGRTMREVLGEAAWEAVGPHVATALSGRTADFEAEVPYARGGTRWVHAIYTPHRDPEGRVAGLVVMVLDIGARHRAEEALREADRRKNEFLAVLAHELRNPLAPIRAGLEVLRLSGDAPSALGRVRPVLERQVAHMARLVDDLLDIARITSGKIVLQRQPARLAELVQAALDATRDALAQAGLQVVTEIPAAAYVIEVDQTRFVQVLANLLHNAAKFTGHGGRVTLAGTIEPGQDGPWLRLTVSDTGAGIPRDLLPRVFDLFVQGGDARAAASGLGIGLALARQIVELHGGSIDAASDGPGCGSVFTIRLPAASETTVPLAIADLPRPAVANRVLIIDDHADAAETLAELVRALGGTPLTASTGEEGLQRADQFRPDVILLDIGLPGMDGYATCARLRTTPAGLAARIVALTGWGQDHDRRRALTGGFDAHLTKPADPRALQALLAAPVPSEADPPG